MIRATYTMVVMMVTGHGVKARGFLALGGAIAGGFERIVRSRARRGGEVGERKRNAGAALGVTVIYAKAKVAMRLHDSKLPASRGQF